MDKTTKWLLRIASGVVIISGVGGVSIFLANSDLLNNTNKKIINEQKVSQDVPNLILKKGDCPKSHNISAGRYCMTEEGYNSGEWRNYVKADDDAASFARSETRFVTVTPGPSTITSPSVRFPKWFAPQQSSPRAPRSLISRAIQYRTLITSQVQGKRN